MNELTPTNVRMNVTFVARDFDDRITSVITGRLEIKPSSYFSCCSCCCCCCCCRRRRRCCCSSSSCSCCHC